MQPSGFYGGSLDQNSYTAPKRGFWTRGRIIIGCVVFLLVVALIGVASLAVSSPRGSGSNMVSLLQESNANESYKLLSPTAKSATSKEEWVTFVVNNKSVLENKKVEKAYSEKLDDTIVEEAYNVGDTGNIYRVTIRTSQAKDSKGLVETVQINRTNL
jgi:hypothetical protein